MCAEKAKRSSGQGDLNECNSKQRVPTGGIARERESVDLVILISRRFQSRQYSLDERRTSENKYLNVTEETEMF